MNKNKNKQLKPEMIHMDHFQYQATDSKVLSPYKTYTTLKKLLLALTSVAQCAGHHSAK